MLSRKEFLQWTSYGTLYYLVGCQEPDTELPPRTPLLILPYLQSVDTTSALILWESESPVRGAVEVYEDGILLETFGETLEKSRFHKIPITGLQSATTYQYQVKELGKTVGPLVPFKTALPRASTKAFSFIVVGDTGIGGAEQLKVADQMTLKRPDFMLHTGDIAYDGYVAEYPTKFFSPYRALIQHVCLYPIFSDHDWDPIESHENGHAFFKFFSLPNQQDPKGCSYWFIHGNALFIALDSLRVNRGVISIATQTSFLETVLAANTDLTWKFVYVEKPFFTNEKGNSPTSFFRDSIQPILERYGVTAVFSGDSHVYERFLQKGIYYIVTGGGGAELGTLNSKTSLPSEVSASRYHFVQIQIEASVLELAVYDLEGELIDHLQIQK